jgi:transposase InsO family protein
MLTVANRPARKRLSFECRCEIAARVRLGGESPSVVAATSGVHRSTVYRLCARFDSGGWAALADQRPVPHRQPRRLEQEVEARIINARAVSGYGPLRLAALLQMPASTIAKVLRRAGLSRTPRAPRPPVRRYERQTPGELLHVDTKRLGRFHTVGKRILHDGIQRSPRAGWQHLHVAIDDHTRIAYCEVLPGQGKDATCAFLCRAVAWFDATHNITIQRVLTDNGHAYRSHLWRDTCQSLNIQRRRTRPYRPQTNGKAEAFIGTALREWAYRYPYPSSAHRTRALTGWVRWYNRRRPHSSLGGQPPISRVAQVREQLI